MLFDRILGDAHAPRDFSLRQIVDPSQDQSALRLGRQSGDRLGQPPQRIPVGGDTLWRRRSLGQIPVVQIVKGLEGNNPRPPHMSRNQRPRRLKQIGLGVPDIVDPIPRR
jgi:hypothetical protein